MGYRKTSKENPDDNKIDNLHSARQGLGIYMRREPVPLDDFKTYAYGS